MLRQDTASQQRPEATLSASDSSPDTNASEGCSIPSLQVVDDTARMLVNLLRDRMPSATDIYVEGLQRSAGGFSRENWMFDVHWRDASGNHSLPLILRSDPPSSPLETERSREFALLKALEATEVPTPKVYWLDNEGRWLGKPSMLVERMPGACEWTVLNSDRPLSARVRLAEGYIKTLARIHNVDWRETGLVDLLEEPRPNPAEFALEEWGNRLERMRLEPLPEMDIVAAWLRKHLPKPNDVVLVHGDYKPGNSLVDGDQITAILDWETAHLGDPLEDLGWMLMPPRRQEQQIKGHWEQEQILASYTLLTGRAFSEATVRWWIIFSVWKLSVNNLAALKVFVAQHSDSISQTPSWLFRRMFQLMAEGS
jgi:aminoglycoside phosphotransferase (APT) family kinase protein